METMTLKAYYENLEWLDKKWEESLDEFLEAYDSKDEKRLNEACWRVEKARAAFHEASLPLAS